MLDYLIEKLPLIRAWIDETVKQHVAKTSSVKNVTKIYGFNRLTLYFTKELLSNAKFVLVDKIPMPPLSAFGLTEFTDFEKGDYAGITYQNVYFIKRQNCTDESLHFHELVHVVQWDCLGIDKFLIAYALGLLENGYYQNPLEVMAREHQQRFIDGCNPYPVEDSVRTDIDDVILRILRQGI